MLRASWQIPTLTYDTLALLENSLNFAAHPKHNGGLHPRAPTRYVLLNVSLQTKDHMVVAGSLPENNRWTHRAATVVLATAGTTKRL